MNTFLKLDKLRAWEQRKNFPPFKGSILNKRFFPESYKEDPIWTYERDIFIYEINPYVINSFFFFFSFA